MTQTQEAGKLILEAFKKEKAKDYVAAVELLEKGLECLEVAKRDEKYGETGLGILEQKKAQYTKKLAKLRDKLPPEKPFASFSSSANSEYENTSAHVHAIVKTEPEEGTRLYPRVPIDEVDAPRHPLPGMVGTAPEYSPGKFQRREHFVGQDGLPLSTFSIAEDLSFLVPGIKPGEADYKHLEAALKFQKKGEEADKEARMEEALDLMSKANEFFTLSVTEEISNKDAIKRINERTDKIAKRIEILQKVLEVNTSREDKINAENAQDDIPQIDETTLQRRPPQTESKSNPEIVGLDAPKEVLNEAKTRLEIGGNDHYNILIVGAPGTGKTSLVKSICQDSRKVDFFFEDSREESDILGLFNDARSHKPSMICIDDIDDMDSTSAMSLVKQLNENPENNTRMILICIASRPWLVDSCLRQCFDIVVFAPLPDENERMIIIRNNMKDVHHCLTDVDFENIAAATEGYTGDDINNLMNAATLQTVRELQKATHFRVAPYCEGEDEASKVWVPCDPEDEGAKPMTLQKKIEEALDLRPSEVTYNDIVDALSTSNRSVSASEDFRLRNWVYLTQKAPQKQLALLQRKPDMGENGSYYPEMFAAIMAASSRSDDFNSDQITNPTKVAPNRDDIAKSDTTNTATPGEIEKNAEMLQAISETVKNVISSHIIEAKALIAEKVMQDQLLKNADPVESTSQIDVSKTTNLPCTMSYNGQDDQTEVSLQNEPALGFRDGGNAVKQNTEVIKERVLSKEEGNSEADSETVIENRDSETEETYHNVPSSDKTNQKYNDDGGIDRSSITEPDPQSLVEVAVIENPVLTVQSEKQDTGGNLQPGEVPVQEQRSVSHEECDIGVQLKEQTRALIERSVATEIPLHDQDRIEAGGEDEGNGDAQSPLPSEASAKDPSDGKEKLAVAEQADAKCESEIGEEKIVLATLPASNKKISALDSSLKSEDTTENAIGEVTVENTEEQRQDAKEQSPNTTNDLVLVPKVEEEMTEIIHEEPKKNEEPLGSNAIVTEEFDDSKKEAGAGDTEGKPTSTLEVMQSEIDNKITKESASSPETTIQGLEQTKSASGDEDSAPLEKKEVNGIVAEAKGKKEDFMSQDLKDPNVQICDTKKEEVPDKIGETDDNTAMKDGKKADAEGIGSSEKDPIVN